MRPRCWGVIAIAPFADIPLGRNELYLPMYESARAVCELLSSVFLFGQFTLTRATSVLILAGGYLFSASLRLFHEVSFPDLFAPAGLLWANGQTTAWLYFLWHLGFPVAVIGFALSADRTLRRTSPGAACCSAAAAVLGALIAAALALSVATAAAHELPKPMRSNQDWPAKYAVV